MVSIDLYSTSILLRYVSEWDPRETAHTKGGYLDGEIRVPKIEGPLTMVIQTFPSAEVESQVSEIHPCLLHVVRMGKGKRDQALEPVPTHYNWKQTFLIQDEKVKILNRLSDLDFEKDGRPRNVPLVDTVTEVHANTIVMGRKRGELNLIILQPKQRNRAKNSEATLTKVLADRMGLKEDDKTIVPLEKFFKGKNAKNLKKIRLKVEFFNSAGQSVGWSVSPQTVIDTGSKEIGCMDFYDASPLKSCSKGGRKIIMVSEYSLYKDVAPIFQVYDETGDLRKDMAGFIRQPDPKEINLKNQTIIFISPEQPMLQEIQAHIGNFSIKLRAMRAGDGYISEKCFNFRFTKHEENGNCLFCDCKVDSDELVQIEVGIPRSKPMKPKRVMNKSCLEQGASGKRIRVVSSGDELSLKSEPISLNSHLSSKSNQLGRPADNLVASPSHYHISDSGMGSRHNSGRSDLSSSSDCEDMPTLTKTEPFSLPDVRMELRTENQAGALDIHGNVVASSLSRFQIDALLTPEKEVRDILGMSVPVPQNVEMMMWDNKERQIIEEINMDDLLNANMEATLHSGHGISTLRPFQIPASQVEIPDKVCMNDPMVSHGSLTLAQSGEKHAPVLLQRRFIKSDSTKAEDRHSEVMEESDKPKDKEWNYDEVEETNKDFRSITRQAKQGQKNTILEEIPLLTIMLIFTFFIFQTISDAFYSLPVFPVLFLSFVLSTSIIFIKNKMNSFE